MKRTILLLALFNPAFATDYEPVRCDSPAPYAGAPMHAALEMNWDVSGSLDGSFDAATQRRLTAAVDKAMAATAASSMTVAVAVPGIGLWSAERTADGKALTAPLHYWASAGKTLTALAVLRLVEASKLSLSDPVSRYVDGVPNGEVITIEALLNHTSGLFSANEDLKVRERKRPLTFDEELAVLRRHGAMFCPGEQWRYTNSGYTVLGRILEVINGRSFDEVIAATVVAPLGSTNLRMLGRNDPATDVAPLQSSDPGVEAMRPTSAGAAGPMAATGEAVVRFWHAVLNGRVVTPDTLERMFADLYPMFGQPLYYGLGVMLYVVPQPDGTAKRWLGHSGGAPGVNAMFAYSPSDRAFVAVALSGDGSAEATANLVVGALANARPRSESRDASPKVDESM